MVCLQDGLAHMRGVTWRAAPAKFKTGMCEMKILGPEVLQHWFRVGTHAWCNLFRVVPAKFKTGMCELKIFGLKFVVCLGTLVQDGLAHMRGVIWRAAPAKFKTGMCELKIFGLKFVVCLGTLVQDGLAHVRGVKWRAAPAKFKTGMCEMKILGSEVLCWHTCVVSPVPSCSGKVRNRDV